jgi:hypothetical protein
MFEVCLPIDDILGIITLWFLSYFLLETWYLLSIFNDRWNYLENNDSLPPKDTTFYHLPYVARWSPTTF